MVNNFQMKAPTATATVPGKLVIGRLLSFSTTDAEFWRLQI